MAFKKAEKSASLEILQFGEFPPLFDTAQKRMAHLQNVRDDIDEAMSFIEGCHEKRKIPIVGYVNFLIALGAARQRLLPLMTYGVSLHVFLEREKNPAFEESNVQESSVQESSVQESSGTSPEKEEITALYYGDQAYRSFEIALMGAIALLETMKVLDKELRNDLGVVELPEFGDSMYENTTDQNNPN